MVTPAWLEACTDQRKRVSEVEYALGLPEDVPQAAAAAPAANPARMEPLNAGTSTPGHVPSSPPDACDSGGGLPLAALRLWVDPALAAALPASDLDPVRQHIMVLGGTILDRSGPQCTHVACNRQEGEAYRWVRHLPYNP